MPFRVGEYVTVTGPGPEWHGEIIARLPNSFWRVRVGGTGGSSMISSDVAENLLRKIMPDRRVVRRVIVALFKADTQSCQNLTIQQRMTAMKKAIDALKVYVDKQEPLEDNEHRIRCIFLAPEYMFANKIDNKDHGQGDRRQIEAADNHTLRNFFAEISANFKNALIIPGSVAWRKPLKADGDPDRMKQKALTKGMTLEDYQDKYRRDKYKKALFGAIDVIYTQKELSGSDWWNNLVSPLDYANGRPVYSYGQKWYQLDTATYIAKNTAHCYYNGRCIAKYNKIGDYHEVLHGTDTVHIPNPLAGRFDCGGMRFGVSICYDQSLSRMGNGGPWKGLQYTADPVDFHILLSAHIPPATGSANLLDEGFLLSCSSSDGCNKVISKGGVEVARKVTGSYDGIAMDVYRV
jgi:predicted amidohydrolase